MTKFVSKTILFMSCLFVFTAPSQGDINSQVTNYTSPELANGNVFDLVDGVIEGLETEPRLESGQEYGYEDRVRVVKRYNKVRTNVLDLLERHLKNSIGRSGIPVENHLMVYRTNETDKDRSPFLNLQKDLKTILETIGQIETQEGSLLVLGQRALPQMASNHRAAQLKVAGAQRRQLDLSGLALTGLLSKMKLISSTLHRVCDHTKTESKTYGVAFAGGLTIPCQRASASDTELLVNGTEASASFR